MIATKHSGRVSEVRYYECSKQFEKERCPIKRVNADSLHREVIQQIRRAAEHPTRMAELIREACKAVPVQESLRGELSAISKAIKDAEKRIRTLVAAIETGGSGLPSLLERLEELQSKRDALLLDKEKTERKIAAGKLKSPDADKVRGYWKRFLEVWEEASEEERNELMPLIVEKIVLKDKNRGVCRLNFFATKPRFSNSFAHSDVANYSNLGALQAYNSKDAYSQIFVTTPLPKGKNMGEKLKCLFG
jgi:hypothetical protein